jgi:transposase
MRRLLKMCLQQIELIEQQMDEVTKLAAESMQACHEAIERLAEIPGIRVIAAQAIVAEIGPEAAAFPSAAHLASWTGACPGREESAGENRSGRCPKGNRYLRRVLCQAAQAAVKTKNCSFQTLFRRLVPRLGYVKAIWAVGRHMLEVIWKILHTGARYQERGGMSSLQAVQRRAQRLAKDLRHFGYTLEIKPHPATAP